MKFTCKAPANIAFIKYWGKRDEALRIPLNDSLSMNLSGAYTRTTVEVVDDLKEDMIELVNGDFSHGEKKRISAHLDRIREKSEVSSFARVVTQNSFPRGTGIASSASGFAALTVAGASAYGVSLSEKELTILARLGSGSACRSIPDGYVMWENEYAYSLYPSTYWKLFDILLITNSEMKKVATTSGMEQARSSPLLPERLASVLKRLENMKQAFEKKDFEYLGVLIEEDCLSMHEVMRTQNPSLVYFDDTTRKIIDAVRQWRREGIAVYFTIDAGPNVHLICEQTQNVLEKVKNVPGIEKVVVNEVSEGARIVSNDQLLISNS